MHPRGPRLRKRTSTNTDPRRPTTTSTTLPRRRCHVNMHFYAQAPRMRGSTRSRRRLPKLMRDPSHRPKHSFVSKVSDLSSKGLLVDLDQENASVWSPSPESYLEKHPPPIASDGGGGGGVGGATNLRRPPDPGRPPLTSHTPTHARMA